MIFETANEAFEYSVREIVLFGRDSGNTLELENKGFYIERPDCNIISNVSRRWSESYAKEEMAWYLSGNRSVSEIKKRAKLWDKMHSGDDIVNSNYGYQWMRNDQIGFVVNELVRNQLSRRAYITIYDGKEHSLHTYDTPCTLNIGFNIRNEELHMTVIMRSNDLWYGFCNDQYCFSELMKIVCERLNERGVRVTLGCYYHFAQNLHLYKDIIQKHIRI